MTNIRTVGVLGSGIMGTGIAEVAALAGFQVVVRTRTHEAGEALRARVRRSLDRKVAKGKLQSLQRDESVMRISHTTYLDKLGDCDLIVECVPEDLAVKREMFAQLGRIAKPEALLASNTSTLPIVELAVTTTAPERVCGIHFFNPAPVMPLVEVVRPITASDATVAAARSFAQACGKEPIEVADRAGFVVNALLFPYLNNAVRMLESGVASRDDIDKAMTHGCNFPMGPLELLDLVGLDTSVSILDALHIEFGDSNYATVPTLRRMVAAGRLGKKAGRGFYNY